ncbi:cysteine-rich receptor-like protein kinase 29 [Camellia sinensis]|uniref:cysteine-rich receptor-like protein kinase 29 n=1 Tax=Camellia sinensis TaxID=4442 RepID=UPI0010365267|nr:cysteine-rich receptor-like protein kinase 29 [Camellia sinensis]XP_028113569.1 cysteine-rich receptor-like protein kinase 29 [Camellia sinensis]
MPSIKSLQFDFGTIRDATDNFSHANKLGEGGFGPVYKGVLLNGREIAVKKLSGNSRQGQEEFKNEVLLLTKLRHKNLISLLGFCLEEKELLLIYEFMPNKSPDHFIFDHVKRAHLDWKKRFNIIQGFARGLLYLHEDSQPRIIHRDLKASNILLDAEMNPKISDFGTGRLIALDHSHYTTSRIMGTIGYMPPEYFQRGQFSVKSNVFSFSVILLEILSGQKIFCFRDMENGEDLLSYAWKCWRKNTILDIVDSTLITGPKSEIMRCIHIGLLCVQENAADRPTMAIVVSMLISNSFSLSLPLHPAFLLPERQGQGNLSHEFNSILTESSDQSETKSTQVSTNDVTITELVARW